MASDKTLKQLLLDALEQEILQSIERLTRGYDNVRDASIKAQGRMESRYDTIKEEQGKLADSIGLQVLAQQTVLNRLRYFKSQVGSDKHVFVAAGSLVKVAASYGHDYFFVVEGGGGISVEVQGEEITCISPETSVASALLGHCLNDTVEFKRDQSTMQLKIIGLQ